MYAPIQVFLIGDCFNLLTSLDFFVKPFCDLIGGVNAAWEDTWEELYSIFAYVRVLAIKKGMGKERGREKGRKGKEEGINLNLDGSKDF